MPTPPVSVGGICKAVGRTAPAGGGEAGSGERAVACGTGGGGTDQAGWGAWGGRAVPWAGARPPPSSTARAARLNAVLVGVLEPRAVVGRFLRNGDVMGMALL